MCFPSSGNCVLSVFLLQLLDLLFCRLLCCLPAEDLRLSAVERGAFCSSLSESVLLWCSCVCVCLPEGRVLRAQMLVSQLEPWPTLLRRSSPPKGTCWATCSIWIWPRPPLLVPLWPRPCRWVPWISSEVASTAWYAMFQLLMVVELTKINQ